MSRGRCSPSRSPSRRAPAPCAAVHSSPVPKSCTNPRRTSPIVGPSATAIETAKKGKPRLAFSEPSMGSTTTHVASASAPTRSSPSSSETRVNERPAPLSRATMARSAASSTAVVSSPPRPVPTTGSRAARSGSCRRTPSTSRTAARHNASHISAAAPSTRHAYHVPPQSGSFDARSLDFEPVVLVKFHVKQLDLEGVCMATIETHASLSIGDKLAEARAETAEPSDRDYLQLRRELDIGAFGTYAIRADAGKQLVDERSAIGYARDAHEELYVVLSGRATFVVDGDEIDAGPARRFSSATSRRREPRPRRRTGPRCSSSGADAARPGGRLRARRCTTSCRCTRRRTTRAPARERGGARASTRATASRSTTSPAWRTCSAAATTRSSTSVTRSKPPRRSRENARTDDDFASVREDPRFIALVA